MQKVLQDCYTFACREVALRHSFSGCFYANKSRLYYALSLLPL